MRLLIVGSLQGQIGLATKIAMDKGAKVSHANDIEQALASLRGGVGAVISFSGSVMVTNLKLAHPTRYIMRISQEN